MSLVLETPQRLRYGDPGMRRVRLGLFAAGLATFALLYTPQPLLPLLSRAFSASPAAASLAMSAGTGALALAIIPVSSLSEVYGRRRVMVISVLAAAVLGLVAPLAPSLTALVLIRVLQGFALAGVPATAMAYLAEEVEAGSLGRAMGLYIAGNAIGGLSGRIAAGVLAEHGGWRVAVAGVSGLALVCAVAFAVALPRSAFFTPVPPRLEVLGASLRRNLADTGLLRLYLIGFALMGAFVTVYNYLTFRLSGAPFGLSTSVIGALFTVYLAGTYSSTMAGRLADRLGRRIVLVIGVVVAAAGVVLTLPASLPCIVAGLVVLTAGFFAAHSVASGWVGGRAPVAPAQASALYLCLYYIGSSVAGSAGGVFYARGGWPSTVVFVLALFAVALASGVSLRKLLGLTLLAGAQALVLDKLEQHRLHVLRARDLIQREVAVLARRLEDHRAGAEHPVEQGGAVGDVHDAGQREVPAVADEDAVPDPHPPGRQLIGRRSPAEQRDREPPHQQDDGDREQCQSFDVRRTARRNDHFQHQQRRHHEERHRYRPHQHLPVRVQDHDGLLAHRERFIIRHAHILALSRRSAKCTIAEKRLRRPSSGRG
ncbi:MAG TPA: MFS transporter [Trebonia sp.]|jgi:YNFM family putative membrane transporter|nr:MFS transporter [Trebonia sp.]